MTKNLTLTVVNRVSEHEVSPNPRRNCHAKSGAPVEPPG